MCHQNSHLHTAIRHQLAHPFLQLHGPLFHVIVLKSPKSLVRHKCQLIHGIFPGMMAEHPQVGGKIHTERGFQQNSGVTINVW
jgi:hypothetical protein